MTAPELSLKNISQKAQCMQDKTFRVSDFLTDGEKEERVKARANASAKHSRRLYDNVDAFIAEVIARFGFETYRAWLNGELATEKLSSFIYAERARDKRTLAPLEALIVSSIAGSNHPTKGGKLPKSLKNAIKILKEEQKRGAENG